MYNQHRFDAIENRLEGISDHETALKVFQMTGDTKITYPLEAEISMSVQSLKTMEIQNNFFQINERGVLPFIRDNGQSEQVLLRVTVEMAEDAFVLLREIYWTQDFISDVGGFYIAVYSAICVIYAFTKFRYDEN